MTLDEWHEQAARKAYEEYRKHFHLVSTWNELYPQAQVVWLNIARAVLGEGRIEVRPSAELAEAETREENERLKAIAGDWSRLASAWQGSAMKLRDERNQLKEINDRMAADAHAAERQAEGSDRG